MDAAPHPFPVSKLAIASTEATSLYIHIPFCDVRCPYCHFYCFVNQDESLPLRYVRALATELEAYRERGLFHQNYESIYFGGGTPSALPDEARAYVCDWIARELAPRLVSGGEITVEMNPESLNRTMLREWVGAGVNRVSVGIQSMNADVLKFLGRLNSPERNREVLGILREEVGSVSADLILATPGSGWDVTLDSLQAIVAGGVQHVSAYLLEIHRETRFGRDVAAGSWTPQPDEQQSDNYLKAVAWLAERDFSAYELSNFALAGYESRHNRRYWRHQPYLGLGASAHSYADLHRWWNISVAGEYCRRVEAAELPVDGWEALDSEALKDEALLLGLRTREGVLRSAFEGREGMIKGLVGAGLLTDRGEMLAATPAGWLVMDQIVAQIRR